MPKNPGELFDGGEHLEYAVIGYDEEYLDDKVYNDDDWWICYCKSKEQAEKLLEAEKHNPTVRIVTRTYTAWT